MRSFYCVSFVKILNSKRKMKIKTISDCKRRIYYYCIILQNTVHFHEIIKLMIKNLTLSKSKHRSSGVNSEAFLYCKHVRRIHNFLPYNYGIINFRLEQKYLLHTKIAWNVKYHITHHSKVEEHILMHINVYKSWAG